MQNKIEIVPAQFTQKYMNEYNIRNNDYFHLKINGEVNTNIIYRMGGLTNLATIKNDKYFMLLKYKEIHDEYGSFLKGYWVMLNHKGQELMEFEPYDNVYPIKNTPIYVINSKYGNAETREIYCESTSPRMETNNFLFLNNLYDKDPNKRGVLMINKNDGTYIVHS